jgi:7-carboxy-7-deazaguanine synthase
MLISEIFYSVQGEGIAGGTCRRCLCGLRGATCAAGGVTRRMHRGSRKVTEMSVAAIFDAVNQCPTRFVVVTGGEPMMAKEMPLLLAKLRQAGKHITIETAGTIAPEGRGV